VSGFVGVIVTAATITSLTGNIRHPPAITRSLR
jgi:hypothetical protein